MEAFIWYKEHPKPKGNGWYFLTGEGWSEFGPDQNTVLESRFASTNNRLCPLPKGHNVATKKAAVDFDRMLLLNAKCPDFAAATTILPDALPVKRQSRPSEVLVWRPFDASDSELLSMCLNAGRSCAVLYGPRAIVVDVQTKYWTDCLWACGIESRTELESYGPVLRDELPSRVVEVQQHEDSSSDDDSDDGIPTAEVGKPREFQTQVEHLVAMGYKWKDAQWALAKAATLEEAATLLIDRNEAISKIT